LQFLAHPPDRNLVFLFDQGIHGHLAFSQLAINASENPVDEQARDADRLLVSAVAPGARRTNPLIVGFDAKIACLRHGHGNFSGVNEIQGRVLCVLEQVAQGRCVVGVERVIGCRDHDRADTLPTSDEFRRVKVTNRLPRGKPTDATLLA
jgi:hypothetical protein